MTFSPDSSPARISPNKALEPAGTSPQPPKDFSSYMQDSHVSHAKGPEPLSPANMAQGGSKPPSMESILNQAKSAQDGLGVVGKQLQTQNLKLKRSHAHLLKNKLTDANEYIRQVGSKVGVETPAMTMTPGTSPLGKFIAYVNDGQDQLIQVQNKLKQMSAKGQQLNAAEMLSVTVKMNLASQEIEYSTTLLGKVIDSVKQIMNTQL